MPLPPLFIQTPDIGTLDPQIRIVLAQQTLPHEDVLPSDDPFSSSEIRTDSPTPPHPQRVPQPSRISHPPTGPPPPAPPRGPSGDLLYPDERFIPMPDSISHRRCLRLGEGLPLTRANIRARTARIELWRRRQAAEERELQQLHLAIAAVAQRFEDRYRATRAIDIHGPVLE
jgi:hypothetical protein